MSEKKEREQVSADLAKCFKEAFDKGLKGWDLVKAIDVCLRKARKKG